MKLPTHSLVALVDGENFDLFVNEGPLFEPKLRHKESPSLDATNFSAGIRAQDGISQRHGRTDLNELAHGAAAAECLNAKAVAGEFEKLLIIADPKTLGEMRHHYHDALQNRLVGEIDKTMTGQSADQIAKIIAAAPEE